MNLTLDGGTAQQRQWFTDAVAKALYFWDDLTANVTVTWPEEPSLPGHQESACTHTIGSESAIEMRRNLDDPEAWPEGKPFYQETAIHELAHVMCFTFMDETQRQEICPWFFKDRIGTGRVWGTADDLNPLDKPWEERIQEAMAEILKDTFMEERYRASDNRTYWKIDPTHWDEFLAFFLPSANPGFERVTDTAGDGGSSSAIYPGGGFYDDPWPRVDGVLYGIQMGTNLNNPDFFPPATTKLRVRWGDPATGLQKGMVEFPLPVSPNAPPWETNAHIGVLGVHGSGEPITWTDENAGKLFVDVTHYLFTAPGSGFPLLEQVIDPDWGTDEASYVGSWAEVTWFTPASDPPEFPYKDSTVASGGNDVGVIRLGPSLLT